MKELKIDINHQMIRVVIEGKLSLFVVMEVKREQYKNSDWNVIKLIKFLKEDLISYEEAIQIQELS